MASTSQVRSWWQGYSCTPTRYKIVEFPGVGRVWRLWVADKSVPIWEAFTEVMAHHQVLFREIKGGTYNCRPPSLHAYGIALDLNPSENPYQCPLVTDMPDDFIASVESIRANGKQAVMWGGSWPCSNPPDPMHFQVNVAPADCKNVTWDQGDDMPLDAADKKFITDTINAAVAKGVSDTWAYPPGVEDPGELTAWQYLIKAKANTDKILDEMADLPDMGGVAAHEHSGGTSGPVDN